jgi:hypothetical protein
VPQLPIYPEGNINAVRIVMTESYLCPNRRRISAFPFSWLFQHYAKWPIVSPGGVHPENSANLR